MFGLILSPFAKILGVIVLILAIFGVGYYKGYASEKDKFNQYKAEVEAEIRTQEAVNANIIKRQDIITEGINNEYQTKLNRLKSSYASGVQLNKSTVTMSSITESPFRTNEEAQAFVLDCAATVQQLMSLQDWLNAQIGNK
jgi:predicted alpha-1,6-mannanase (GH76 family)